MIHARIFKANDIRGVATGPDAEWDADGAYAIGAATADVFEISGERERWWSAATCGPPARSSPPPSPTGC